MRLFVEQAFFEMFDQPDHVWLGYRDRRTVAVQNGVLTGDLLGARSTIITEFRDVIHVWRSGGGEPLAEVSPRRSIANFTSGNVHAIEPSSAVANRPFVVWPSSFTGNVDVLTRARPTIPFPMTQVIYLDHLAVVYGAAWAYVTDMGTNPGQAAKYEKQFRGRMQQTLRGEQAQSLKLDARLGHLAGDWQEV